LASGSMNCCVANHNGGFYDHGSEANLECDYDKNATNLYKAIEKEEWRSVECFFETGKWSYMHFTKDVQSPSEQARTWVTRFESNGEVRWSQLPLHAAIIFRAPKRIVEFLIELYAVSVRCTDDQGMLPLHLAFRVGADDGIMNLLIKGFPEALGTQNQRGLLPYDMDGRDTRKDFNESVQEIVKHVTKSVMASQEMLSKEKTDTLEDSMGVQDRLVKTLERNNSKLENQLAEAKDDFQALRERCLLLEKIIATNKSQAAAQESKNSKSKTATTTATTTTTTTKFRKGKSRRSVPDEADASAVSSVDLNSIRRRNGMDGDAGIELKLKESDEGLFMSIVPNEDEKKADEETSFMGRNPRDDYDAKQRRNSKSNSKLKMHWCGEGGKKNSYVI